MAAANHRFSRPVELNEDDEFKQARLFMQNRRINGLDINPRVSGGNVVTVTDDDQLDDAVRAGLADLLGGRYGYARAGFVRGALRPASRGEGRARFR
jgi:hypothetical protein